MRGIIKRLAGEWQIDNRPFCGLDLRGAEPGGVKGEGMDHQHAHGEIGEIDDEEDGEMHGDHPEPGQRAAPAVEAEGEEKDFSDDGDPAQPDEKWPGQLEQEFPQRPGTGERVR